MDHGDYVDPSLPLDSYTGIWGNWRTKWTYIYVSSYGHASNACTLQMQIVANSVTSFDGLFCIQLP